LDLSPFGKILIFAGISLVVVGIVFVIGGKLIPLGRLPGDIVIRRGNFTFFFPIISSIIASIVLTIILNLIFRK